MTEFRESKSGLMVPAGVAEGQKEWHCNVCGARFLREQAMVRHISKCAEENYDAIRAASPRRGPQDPANWDVEYETWARGGHRKWDNWLKEHRIDRDRERYGH